MVSKTSANTARSSCTYNSDDEWTLVNDEHRSIPTRPREHTEDNVSVELHPLKSPDGIIVSLSPPQVPSRGLTRVSCDIVLVIDVSGSMKSKAPVPILEPGVLPEDTGLSVLDLVKHAARTIIETLEEGDRLSIVTFGNEATVVQPLTPMADANKLETLDRLAEVRVWGATNLWAGLRSGLELFEKGADSSSPSRATYSNASALYVLTDGLPNHMCPKQGYIPKLKPILERMEAEMSNPPSIHTFGFGYQIRSGLLQSIAEAGRGSYGFIPDAGMIGTVFVHAVANLYATFATTATLTLRTTGGLQLESPNGIVVAKNSQEEMVLPLTNIQYGQSRDIFLRYERGTASKKAEVHATLSYTKPGSPHQDATARRSISDTTTSLSPSLINYHIHRAKLCGFLSTLFPLEPSDHEHHPIPATEPSLTTARTNLDTLITSLQQSVTRQPADPHASSLLSDLSGPAPHGQVRIALSSPNHFCRWGRHYLPSLQHAHAAQTCNSFKDPGPLLYGADSPLFCRWRAVLDERFDTLPPPTPSLVLGTAAGVETVGVDAEGGRGGGGGRGARTTVMARYNRADNPCFAGWCLVELADTSGDGGEGGKKIPVRALRPGMRVRTPRGARSVVAVVKTLAPLPAAGGGGDRDGDGDGNGGVVLCGFGGLWITPYHPIWYRGRWVFPVDVAESVVCCSTAVYSVLLAPSRDAHAHAVKVGGRWCVTLGHGVRDAGEEDVRGHAFFGDYRDVRRDLAGLPRGREGVLMCAGVKRDSESGLVNGFVPLGGKE